MAKGGGREAGLGNSLKWSGAGFNGRSLAEEEEERRRSGETIRR